MENSKILVHVFVTCRLDNANALLYGLPKYLIAKVQAVLNCAARLILCKQKYDHLLKNHTNISDRDRTADLISTNI